MKFALGSLALGIVTYVVVLIAQSRQARMDRDNWGELLFISGISASMLTVLMVWLAIADGGKATLAGMIEALFANTGRLPFKVLGFGSISFCSLAAIHVFVLALLERRNQPMTPNKSLERTRDR
jgi:hypothetical protein